MAPDYLRLRELERLEEKLGYSFEDKSRLDLALTHTSYAKGDGNGREHNERLEFLGDAVLELCISEKLFNEYSALNEGALTRARAITVCEASLHSVALRLGLGECIRLGHGEDHSGGREKPSILSDAVEAVIGAVYLDGGIGQARLLIDRLMGAGIPDAVNSLSAKDYKTALQEYVQKRHLGSVAYQLIDATGPDHKKVFTMQVSIAGEPRGSGSGCSKQEAGQNAARAAMQLMGIIK